ncbi:MAG TPA: PIN domain-containing protein [Phototrophicaceae bacterium]|nr:PIN domain-containing protein [Phototrophicaceae bacterium]
MRVLVDTDVILDVLLARPEFVEAASTVWQANIDGVFEGYISAITPVNVFYIARKIKGEDKAREAVGLLLAAWHICPVHETVLKAALELPIKDFEDAVQHAGANALKIDLIVTRNINHYKLATITVLSPTDFIQKLNL